MKINVGKKGKEKNSEETPEEREDEEVNLSTVGLGGLGVLCSLRDPRFVGSNPAEVDGFFSGHKNPEHKSSGRDFKLRIPSLGFLAR